MLFTHSRRPEESKKGTEGKKRADLNKKKRQSCTVFPDKLSDPRSQLREANADLSFFVSSPSEERHFLIKVKQFMLICDNPRWKQMFFLFFLGGETRQDVTKALVYSCSIYVLNILQFHKNIYFIIFFFNKDDCCLAATRATSLAPRLEPQFSQFLLFLFAEQWSEFLTWCLAHVRGNTESGTFPVDFCKLSLGG